MLEVSAEALGKLLKGEYKTMRELYGSNLDPNQIKVSILYKRLLNSNREEYIYVIDSIFINE